MDDESTKIEELDLDLSYGEFTYGKIEDKINEIIRKINNKGIKE